MGSTITFVSGPHGFSVGDRIKFDSDTNRIRRRITDLLSATTLTIFTIMRASKGFRRHVRRAKASQRAAGVR